MSIDLPSLVSDYEIFLRTDTDRTARFEKTISLVDSIRKDFEKVGGLRERGATERDRDHWYTRLASALTEYITSPNLRLNMSEAEEMCRRKQTFAYIFSASGYRGMSHLTPLMSTVENNVTKVDKKRAAVLLAFISLDAMSDELLDVALQQPPKLLLILMLGWLNTRAVITLQGEKNRARLLEAGELIVEAPVSDSDIPHIINAWMYSSYALTPKKHEIKKHFNRLLKKLMPWEVPAPAVISRRQTARKPKMLVIHERFTEVHAMYRCYAPSISKLRQHFELVTMAEEAHIDEAGKAIFDQVITVAEKKNISSLAKQIYELAPDMIYYPSLGMSHWTVLLAQLRLAPIQIMTHGHPATSMSDVIDYAYVCKLEGDLASIHSEKLIVGPDVSDLSPHTHLPSNLPDLATATDRQVRVAVNSKVMKLSSSLVQVCKRLRESASVPVVFSFFPGERGLYFDGLEAAIKAEIPSADVIPYVPYAKFLEEICKCDLALAAFPFGNTNSTVDTSLLGLPTVAHFGPEAPAQSDQHILRTAGLAEWLVCQSDETYFQTALRLIESPSERTKALNGLRRADIADNLFNDTSKHDQNPFADICHYLYQHHDQLSNSNSRVYGYQELLNG